MRKQNSLKILLCAMLLAIGCNVAWGATIGSLPITTLDVANPTATLGGDWSSYGKPAYSVTEDYVFVHAYAAAAATIANPAKQTWVKYYNNSVNGSNAAWDAMTPFPASSAFGAAGSTERSDYYLTLQTGRWISFRVTNATSVKVYCKNNSTSRLINLLVYEVSGTPAAAASDATYTVEDNSGSTAMILSQNLDKTKEYMVTVSARLVSGKDGNSQLYEVAFGRPATSSVEKPTFSPAEGAINAVPTNITLSQPAGCTVYYTTDGSTPTSSSTQYTAPFAITGPTTVKAIAINGSAEASNVATAVYTYTYAGPTIEVDNRSFVDPFDVTITNDNSYEMYYTLDGSTPTASSTHYTGAITISGANTTLKAINVDAYGNESEVSTKVYEYIDFTKPFTLVFKESGSSSNDGTTSHATSSTMTNVFSAGADYASALSAVYKVYPARTGRGAKFGGGDETGSVTIKLAQDVVVSKIVVNASGYSSSDKGNLVIGEDSYTVTTYASNSFANFEKTYNTPTQISAITVGSGVVDDKNYRIYVKSITVYPAEKITDIAVTDAEYATYFNSAKAYYMPAGLEGITVTGVAGDALTLTTSYAAGAVVPAGEPLILHGAEGPYTLYAGETSNTVVAENKLKGTSTDDEMTTGNVGDVFYRLSKHGNNVGFYYGAEGGAAFKPGANKAYLAISNNPSTPAPSYFLFNDTEEGIMTGVASTEAVVETGKFIENGQLIIVKDGVRYNSVGQIVR